MIGKLNSKTDELAQQSLALALRKINDRDYQSALVICRKVMSLLAETNPSMERDLHRMRYLEAMGDAFLGMGIYDEALAKFEEAITLGTRLHLSGDSKTVGLLFKIERVLDLDGTANPKSTQNPFGSPTTRWRASEALQLQAHREPAESKRRSYGIKDGTAAVVEEKQESAQAEKKTSDPLKTAIVLDMAWRALQVVALPVLLIAMLVQLQAFLRESDLTDLAEQTQDQKTQSGSILDKYLLHIFNGGITFVDLDRSEELKFTSQSQMQVLAKGNATVELPYFVQEQSIPSLAGVWAGSIFRQNLWLKPNGYGFIDVQNSRMWFQSDSNEYAVALNMVRLSKEAPTDRAHQEYTNPFTKSDEYVKVEPVVSNEQSLWTDPTLTRKLTKSNRWYPGAIICLENASKKVAVYYGVDRKYALFPFKCVSGKKNQEANAEKPFNAIVIFGCQPEVVMNGGVVGAAVLAMCFGIATIFIRLFSLKIAGFVLCLCSAAGVVIGLYNQGFFKF